MPARGRPPLPRNVFSFEASSCPSSELVTLDSSFVLNALLSAEPHHAAARRYLESLAEKGTALAYNHLLELELREVAFRVPLKESFPKDWKRRRHDGRTLRRARRLIERTMGAWDELLTAFTYSIVPVETVYGDVAQLMDRFGLQSYDAVHAATAERFGGSAIVTTDAGFTAVPAARLRLYVNQGRLSWCRGMRARRR